MSNYFIVDVHTHPYESKEIGRTNTAGNGQFDICGTLEELTEHMSTAGIDVSFLLAVISRPELVNKAAEQKKLQESERNAVAKEISNHIESRNEWICSKARTNNKYQAFIYLDPLMGTEKMVNEIYERVHTSGAKGIKIHPALGHYFPNDRRLYPVYETAQKLDIPIIGHCGLCAADKEYTAPRHFIDIFSDFPKLKFVMAHLGRIYYEEVLDISRKFQNIFFDTSSAIPGDSEGHILKKAEKFLGPLLSDDEAVDLIREIGSERVMFGSDYPWFHPGNDVKRLLKLDFSDIEKEDILGTNAKNFFSL